jgi:RNA polymerase primary sigma factor
MTLKAGKNVVRLSGLENMLNKNSVSMYLKEIDKVTLLTRDEELELAKRASQGDEEAIEKMIVSNLRFVVSVAKKYQGHGVPLTDLISEGNLGLITAVSKFDYKRGFHFISYAVWWIKQSIIKALSEKSRMVRLPMNRANELMQIGKYIDEYSKQHGSRPRDEKIAEELSMNKDEIKKLLDISYGHSSMEELTEQGEPDFLQKKSIDSAFESTDHPDDRALYSSLQTSIDQLLHRLSDRERTIIEYRFGLNGKEPHSLSRIGAQMNLTKERIRQIEKAAMNQIRNNKEVGELAVYLN